MEIRNIPPHTNVAIRLILYKRVSGLYSLIILFAIKIIISLIAIHRIAFHGAFSLLYFIKANKPKKIANNNKPINVDRFRELIK